MTVIPAYGRDYKSAKAVKADWKAEKDFQIASVGPYIGQYISVRDAETNVHETIFARYCKLTKIVQVFP